ncbi:hypothetical protein [Nitrobacter sp.]|uniref:hypothetical protein n=1 Tax=Nitrobacter sp. TaxID=29420 RepID=UPI0029CAC612|nr:hypothetical protein [Nitrobacter sp.]
MKTLLTWAASRLKEPSTYAGIAAALGLVGINLDPGTAHWIAVGGSAAAAALSVVVPEL